MKFNFAWGLSKLLFSVKIDLRFNVNYNQGADCGCVDCIHCYDTTYFDVLPVS